MEHPLAVEHKETIVEEDIESPIQDQTSKNPSYEPAVKIQDPEYYTSSPEELFSTLKKLSENGQNQDALNIIEKVEPSFIKEGNRETIITLKLYKISTFASLSKLQEASTELLDILEDERKSGDWNGEFPFGLIVAQAQIKTLLTRNSEPLYEVLNMCRHGRETVVTVSEETWEARTMFVLRIIAKRLVLQKKYSSAIQIMEQILEIDPEDVVTLSDIGRLYVYIGGLTEAELFFKEVESVIERKGRDKVPQFMLGAAENNMGLLKFVRDDYSEALKHFEKAQEELGCKMVPSNNVAVSMIYNDSLKKGINAFKVNIHTFPIGNFYQSFFIYRTLLEWRHCRWMLPYIQTCVSCMTWLRINQKYLLKTSTNS